MTPALPKKIPYAKHLAFVLAAFIAYTLFGSFAMPPIIKQQIGKFAAETLQRKTSIGEVRVNPLLLSVEIKDFALTEHDGAPIVGFKRLFADFELSSLLRFAWTFRAIELEGLDLRGDIAPGGRFNLLELLYSLPKTESKPDAKLPRMLLRRVLLSSGAISFSDRSLAEPATARLEPLDLAIALLTDSDGKIDLAVPVSGDVNDPKFSYGPLIWQAIRTVLTKIVTAPFRALGALFGGGGESLEAIAFDPGRAALLPPEQEKLKHVAEGLAKRQQLRLVAEGQTGPADRAALQQRDVARAVNSRLGRAPAAATQDPDPVNVADAKTQRALEAVFIERQSEDALAKFIADVAKSRNREVSRVNAALALIGTASADREFYGALLKRLNDGAQVPDAALAQLAGDRARAVTGHMTSVLAIAAERAEARVAKAPGEARVKLELDVTTAK